MTAFAWSRRSMSIRSKPRRCGRSPTRKRPGRRGPGSARFGGHTHPAGGSRPGRRGASARRRSGARCARSTRCASPVRFRCRCGARTDDWRHHLHPRPRRAPLRSVGLARRRRPRPSRAIAVDNARLYRLAQEGEAAAALGQSRARFLADVGEALASSLDYETTLRRWRNWPCPTSRTGARSTSSTRRGAAAAGRGPRRPAKVASRRDAPGALPRTARRPGGVWRSSGPGQPTIMADIPDALIAPPRATTTTSASSARSG